MTHLSLRETNSRPKRGSVRDALTTSMYLGIKNGGGLRFDESTADGGGGGGKGGEGVGGENNASGARGKRLSSGKYTTDRYYNLKNEKQKRVMVRGKGGQNEGGNNVKQTMTALVEKRKGRP